jgi:hypothetical protein
MVRNPFPWQDADVVAHRLEQAMLVMRSALSDSNVTVTSLDSPMLNARHDHLGAVMERLVRAQLNNALGSHYT